MYPWILLIELISKFSNPDKFDTVDVKFVNPVCNDVTFPCKIVTLLCKLDTFDTIFEIEFVVPKLSILSDIELICPIIFEIVFDCESVILIKFSKFVVHELIEFCFVTKSDCIFDTLDCIFEIVFEFNNTLDNKPLTFPCKVVTFDCKFDTFDTTLDTLLFVELIWFCICKFNKPSVFVINVAILFELFDNVVLIAVNCDCNVEIFGIVNELSGIETFPLIDTSCPIDKTLPLFCDIFIVKSFKWDNKLSFPSSYAIDCCDPLGNINLVSLPSKNTEPVIESPDLLTKLLINEFPDWSITDTIFVITPVAEVILLGLNTDILSCYIIIYDNIIIN